MDKILVLRSTEVTDRSCCPTLFPIAPERRHIGDTLVMPFTEPAPERAVSRMGLAHFLQVSRSLGRAEAVGWGQAVDVTVPNLGTQLCAWCPVLWAGGVGATEGQGEGGEERLSTL